MPKSNNFKATSKKKQATQTIFNNKKTTIHKTKSKTIACIGVS
jgi:hypothetical protein